MNLSQGYSSGGSQNSAWSTGNSQSSAGTYADAARQWSAEQATIAWQRDMQAMEAQMAFNAEEAQKQRDWQEQMANTIYTRSVKNMREAGINPILAANMGLSGASVGSGATASLGGIPSAPLAQNFMDSWSAGNSMNQSESYGSSWNSSENGLVTALTALGSMVSSALGAITSGKNLTLTIDGLDGLMNNTVKDAMRNTRRWGEEGWEEIKDATRNTEIYKNIADLGRTIQNSISGSPFKGTGGGHGFQLRE